MVYFMGKTLSMHKRVYYALRGAFEGVGLSTATRLCDAAHVHPLARVCDLGEAQWARLKELVQPVAEQRRHEKLRRLKDARTRQQPISPT